MEGNASGRVHSGEGVGCQNLQAPCHHNTMKGLYPHPPRKPDHNLSSEISDQLCHVNIAPRLCKSVQARVFNTKKTMHTQKASYAGMDSANVTDSYHFRTMSSMLSGHETLSMAGRPDINHLASKNLEEGNMMAGLATSIREEAARLYPKGSLTKYLQGSTYVDLSDSMVLHLNPSNSCNEAVVQCNSDQRGQMTKVTISLQRFWSPLIFFCTQKIRMITELPYMSFLTT